MKTLSETQGQRFYFNPTCDVIINNSQNQVALVNPFNNNWIKISHDAYAILQMLSQYNIQEIQEKDNDCIDDESEFIVLVEYLLQKKYLLRKEEFEKLSLISPVDGYRKMITSNLNSIYKRLYLSVTSECNLSCIHCYNNVTRPNNLSNETDLLIYDVLEKLKGSNIKEIILSGGEPFLRTDIFEIIDKSYEITKKVSINTNGLLITNQNIQSLKEYTNLTVAISLDGLTANTHEAIRGKNTFKKTLSIIYLLIENGIKVHIISTITKLNYKELVNFDKFIDDLGIDGNLSFYTPVGTGKKSIDKLFMDENSINEYKELLFKKHQKENKDQSDTNKTINLPIKFNCAAGIGILGIEHNGRVVPCQLFLGKDIFLGNILNESLVDMQLKWIENGILSVDQNNECKTCTIRHFCGNGCIANTYYANGTFNAKDPNCALHKFGLEQKIWRCAN